MKKDFNTGLRKGIEADRVKLTRRRKLLLREMGLAEDLDSTELAEKLHAQTFPDDAWSLDMLDLLRDSVHRRNRGGKSGRGRGRIWRRGWTNCWRGRRST